MGVGDGSLMGNLSYLTIGREATYGTYVTGTAAFAFLSCSMKATKETKILEEIQKDRTNSNSISLGKTVGGEVSGYYSPKSLAANYLLQNAFGGGPVTSATATGDTVGATSFEHTIDIKNFDQTYSSLCMNLRKGQTTTGKIFEYTGIRVNEFTLKAEIDEALMMSASLIAKDVTLSANDLSGSVDTSAQTPLSFVDGRISVEAGGTSLLTTTSYWNVQNMEFKVKNNLISDSSARRIGSDVISVLPAGLAQFEFKATLRFDTTTAFDAMMAGTRLCGEFMFEGPTLTGSKLRESIKIRLPNLRVSDAGDPEIGGPNEMLTSEVTFAVLRDPTASGYAVQAKVINGTSSY